MTRKHLLLVGGGHAHMGLLKRASRFIESGVEVSILSPTEYHIYSGLGPGRVGGTYALRDYCFPIRRLVESAGGRFIRGSAKRIDPDGRIVVDDEGRGHSYDVVSFNVGSVVPYENIVPEEEVHALGKSIFPAKPVRYLEDASRKLAEIPGPVEVAVVGGGPGGGDCIDIENEPLDRVGVYAVRETKYLEQNLRATLWGGSLRPFTKSSKYLLICNLAGGYGVGTKYGLSGAGRVVGLLKRLIDRWFVRSHQKPTQ